MNPQKNGVESMNKRQTTCWANSIMLNGKKTSDEMCTFLVINISSLQLIPVNVIAYRAQYGAVNPAAIVVPGLIATLVSTAVAVLFCRIMCRKGRS